jgi:hypothetical protein
VNKDLRDLLQSTTQAVRAALEEDYREQLGADFDIREDGSIATEPGRHLDADGRARRRKLVAAVEHRRATARNAEEAVSAYVREAAFTTLNRFVALKMLEARGLVLPCVTGGELSSGFKEFTGLAPGLDALPDKGYRLYIESLCDEVAREVRVLFDRTDPASLLWPRRPTLLRLLELVNAPELASVWAEDETIGWVYQYFNSKDERAKMRDVKRGGSQAPRDSHELAVRNQFFTPRYVVEFLVDNTLGRTWWEMRRGQTALTDACKYMVRPPDERISERAPKDPREIRVLDPASGSGHFLLYAYELLETIYEEAWCDPELGPPLWQAAGGSLFERPESTLPVLRRVRPGWILQHNLHGVDIDPRAAQIAALALWMRAQRALRDVPRAERPRIERTNIVVAEPVPGDDAMRADVAAKLPEGMRPIFAKVLDEMALAGDAGTLLRVERAVGDAVATARRAIGGMPRQMSLGNWQKQQALVSEAQVWGEAEARIEAALREYATGATDAAGLRRRMFRHDTVQGLAFIEVCQKKYDVVLMNPPFGAASLRAKKWQAGAYPRSKNDLLACFVERGVEMLVTKGKLGAITSRTAFFLSSYETWRKEVVLGMARPTVFADLGAGVLDGAMVETAAFALEGA